MKGVIDGDTLKVKLITGQTINVRLIGIDTPVLGNPELPSSAEVLMRPHA